MASMFFALALMCSATTNSCQLTESVASPFHSADACAAALKENLKELAPENLDALLKDGGYFAAQCVSLPIGTTVPENMRELDDLLGKPARFRPKPKTDS